VGQPLLLAATGVAVPRPGPRPDRFVAVTVDGALVSVDATTGTVIRELARQADPRVPHTGEGPSPNSISGVALSLDGRTAFFTVSPEPACGNVSEVPVGGGVPESRGDGNHVAAGPNGHYATTSTCAVTVRLGGAALGSVSPPWEAGYRSAAWSPDGRFIAVESSNEGPGRFLTVFDLATGDTATMTGPDDIGYRLPAFRNDGRLVVAEQREGGDPTTAKVVERADATVVGSFAYGGEVVDQAYDATGTWLLVTLADGRLRWFGGGDQGDLGDLGTGFTAADW